MISDVLSDALAALDEYQTEPDYTENYTLDFTQRLNAVKAQMRALVEELDGYPVMDAKVSPEGKVSFS